MHQPVAIEVDGAIRTPANGALQLGAAQAGLRMVTYLLPSGHAARYARAVIRELLSRADGDEIDTSDAELAVGELAANADIHACAPYELRVLMIGDRPIWCSVVDGAPEVDEIQRILDRLHRSASTEAGRLEEPPMELDESMESGRGLAIVHELSQGRCRVFPTILCSAGRPGKAVAFLLPGRSSSCPEPLWAGGRCVVRPQSPITRPKAHQQEEGVMGKHDQKTGDGQWKKPVPPPEPKNPPGGGKHEKGK